uniref:FXYD domain-containing ion transport regulator n=1 Tax=Panagrellus redivivus TaxID=6233 RepID=A0A7E4UQA0_PANRE
MKAKNNANKRVKPGGIFGAHTAVANNFPSTRRSPIAVVVAGVDVLVFCLITACTTSLTIFCRVSFFPGLDGSYALLTVARGVRRLLRPFWLKPTGLTLLMTFLSGPQPSLYPTMSTSKPPTPSSNIFGFDKTNQIMILALTLCVIFIVLVAAVCFFRCRRDRSSYVLDPDLVMPIGKATEREFYV